MKFRCAECRLETEKEKNRKTREELKREHESEFSRDLSNKIESEIWWPVFWKALTSWAFTALIAAGIIYNIKQKYNQKIKELHRKHDQYAEQLKYALDKRKEREEEINAKSAAGRMLRKVLSNISEISEENNKRS